MRQLFRGLMVFGSAALLTACATATKTSTVSSTPQKYNEDLTALRPKVSSTGTTGTTGTTTSPTDPKSRLRIPSQNMQ
ncbi:MAG: hypothetical protein QM762_06550 [Chryseolinea sp.]